MQSGGFIKVYIFLSCLAFLIVACAYYVGKKIPSDDIVISDPVADRYQVAGIDLNENPSLYPDRPSDPYANPYLDAYPRNDAGTGAPADYSAPQPQLSEQVRPDAAVAPIATTSKLVFTSANNDRISFSYPADMKVREEKRSGGISGQGEAIVFTLTNPQGKSITAIYDKSQSGCFDPLRSFAIDPSSGYDYRILYPQKTFFIEEKYQALRNDEEIGKYAFAWSDPARPLVLTSNVCAQTAIPTRLRISSTQFTAADKAYLVSVHDMILSEITL